MINQKSFSLNVKKTFVWYRNQQYYCYFSSLSVKVEIVMIINTLRETILPYPAASEHTGRFQTQTVRAAAVIVQYFRNTLHIS